MTEETTSVTRSIGTCRHPISDWQSPIEEHPHFLPSAYSLPLPGIPSPTLPQAAILLFRMLQLLWLI